MHSFSPMFICIPFFTYIMSFLLHSFLHLLRFFLTLICIFPHFLTSSCPQSLLLCAYILISSPPHVLLLLSCAYVLISSPPHVLFITRMSLCPHFLTSSCPFSELSCANSYVLISLPPHVLICHYSYVLMSTSPHVLMFFFIRQLCPHVFMSCTILINLLSSLRRDTV